MCILNPVSTFLDKTCRLHEVKDERHAEAFFNRVSLAKEDALPLGERVAALTNQQQASRSVNKVKSGPGGSREISFVSRSSAKYKEDEEEDKEERRVKRRGMQSLGLKADRSGPSGFRGRGRGRGGSRGRGRGRGGFRGRGRHWVFRWKLNGIWCVCIGYHSLVSQFSKTQWITHSQGRVRL